MTLAQLSNSSTRNEGSSKAGLVVRHLGWVDYDFNKRERKKTKLWTRVKREWGGHKAVEEKI